MQRKIQIGESVYIDLFLVSVEAGLEEAAHLRRIRTAALQPGCSLKGPYAGIDGEVLCIMSAR